MRLTRRPPSAEVPPKAPKPLPGRPGRGKGPVWGWDLRPGRVAGVPGPAPVRLGRVPGPPPSPPRNSASPLRARGPCPPPGRIRPREAGRRRRARRTRAVGPGSAVARAVPPSAARPAPAQPGRCSPEAADEPGERGREPPSTLCPAPVGSRPSGSRGALSPGAGGLGQPCTLSGPEPRGRPWLATARTGDSHSESRLRHQSGPGRLPGGGPGLAGCRSCHAGLRADLRYPLPA